MRSIIAKAFPVQFIKLRGWKLAFIDDGYGDTGWYAFCGNEPEPEFETSICDTKREAAIEAIYNYFRESVS